jgi:hypothetical protein
MKNYSFIILAAIVCLSATPSHAQDRSNNEAQTAPPPPVESPAPKQPELTIDQQPPATTPAKCQSADG